MDKNELAEFVILLLVVHIRSPYSFQDLHIAYSLVSLTTNDATIDVIARSFDF